MSYSKKFRRAVVLWVLVLVMSAVSAPPTRAAGLGWQQLAGEIGKAAWALFGGNRARIVNKAGCGIDPMGNPLCQPIMPKHGCGIDPLGNPLCQPIAPKHGCSIDPAGKPICGS
jgi:hypothetical protein